MERYTTDRHIEFFVAEAQYDYVSLNEVIAAAIEASDADPALDRVSRSLSLLGRLLDIGFQAVDLIKGGKCRPWPNQDRDTILRIIEEDWRGSPERDEATLGYSYWFDLPDDRRAAAEALTAAP